MTHIHASLSGFTRWELLDTEGRTLQSGARSNLITNAGLDFFADSDALDHVYSYGSSQRRMFGMFRRYLHVGTGTSQPSFADTSLTNRLFADNTGGFNSEQSETYSVSNGLLTVVSRQVRVVDIAQAVNLTEYGLGPSSDTVSIRELFRDAQGVPVVVSAQAGYQLKLTHDLSVSIPYAATPGTINLGTGNLGTSGTFYSSSPTPSQYQYAMAVFSPGRNLGAIGYVTAAGASLSPSVDVSPVEFLNAGPGSGLLPYVSGSYQRTRRFVLPPSAANGTHYGWAWYDYSSSNNCGYKLLLTGGASVTKSSAQRLTLDLTVSWARASAGGAT